MYTSTSPERRSYVCGVCGEKRVIQTMPIEKWVVVCLHPDTRGTLLPVVQLREEGQRILD